MQGGLFAVLYVGMQADARLDVVACPLIKFVSDYMYILTELQLIYLSCIDLADVRLVRQTGGLHPYLYACRSLSSSSVRNYESRRFR
jgi:hypothetical protein